MKSNTKSSTGIDEQSPTMVHLLKEILKTLQKTHGSESLYYDNADMKRLFHLSDSSLYRSRKENKLPFKKIGGKIYYLRSFVDAMT